jgi:hypothetical protein
MVMADPSGFPRSPVRLSRLKGIGPATVVSIGSPKFRGGALSPLGLVEPPSQGTRKAPNRERSRAFILWG